MSAQYEEHFTAFIDFLGFREAAQREDETKRLEVLALLRSLSTLQGEFAATSTPHESGTVQYVKPTISTFSDHIVISYPLRAIKEQIGLSTEADASYLVVYQLQQLLGSIAAAAFKIGFLLRGGATIGNLYHSGGVVFGPALVEAFELEQRTSVYPRIVVSNEVIKRPQWIANRLVFCKEDDGLFCIDFYKMVLFSGVQPGPDNPANLKIWFADIISILQRNITILKHAGKLNELAKWSWFARRYREAIASIPEGSRAALELPLEKIPLFNE